MSEITGTVVVPVDSDGFLRRECPHCEREFKWLPGDRGEPMPAGGYHCAYCDGRSEEAWLTKRQAKLVATAMTNQVEDYLHDEMKKWERHSSEHIEIKVSRSGNPTPTPTLTEPDDMRRVDFECHPAEPAKVLEAWNGPVHCLICGQTASG